MFKHQVHILYMFNNVAIDVNIDIRQLSQTAPIEACKPDDGCLQSMGYFRSTNHVFRISTGRDCNDNIARSDQTSQLLREYIFITFIISKSRDHGHVIRSEEHTSELQSR